MHSRNLKKPIALIVLLAAFIIMPLFFPDPRYINVFIIIGFWVVLALGLQLMMTCGVISVAQWAFVGLGAYTSVLLVMRLGWSFWLAWPLGMVVAGVFAFMIGIIALRAKGVYFIIITLSVSQVLNLLWTRLANITGGTNGILNIPPPNSIRIPGLGAIQFGFGHKVEYYYLGLVVAVVIVFVVYRLNWSRFGIICRSVDSSDVLAQHVGIHPIRYKIIAFTIGSAFAGLIGGLQAHYVFFISSETFPLLNSMYVIIYLIVGGSAGVAGAILGPLFLIFASEELRFMGQYMPLLYGAILIFVMTFIPDGLTGIPKLIGRWVERARKLRRSPQEYAAPESTAQTDR